MLVNTKVFLSFLFCYVNELLAKLLVVLLVVFNRIEKEFESTKSFKLFFFKHLPLVAGAGIEPATS